MEENESEQVLYIKLLTPPYFQMSPYDSSKYELPRLKDDWLRIHNFILDGLMQSGTIDHLQRLHLINNTVVRIVLEKVPKSYHSKLEFRQSYLSTNLEDAII